MSTRNRLLCRPRSLPKRGLLLPRFFRTCKCLFISKVLFYDSNLYLYCRDTFASVLKDSVVTSAKSTSTSANKDRASMVAGALMASTTSLAIAPTLDTRDIYAKWTLMSVAAAQASAILASVDVASILREAIPASVTQRMTAAVTVTVKILARRLIWIREAIT